MKPTQPVTNIYARIGAVLYALWGLAHVLGGTIMLRAAVTGDTEGYLRQVGSAVDGGQYVATTHGSVVNAILAYHAFNLVWAGAVVFLVAVCLNWRNKGSGYWINFVLVGMVDLGLVVFHLIPGLMKWSDGLIGVSLFLGALGFLSVGILQNRAGLQTA